MNNLIRVLVATIILSFFSCKQKKQDETIITSPNAKDSVASLQGMVTSPFAPIDISPMDMSYFPPDYPKLKMTNATAQAPLARIIYSRPHLQGRRLFPDILKYNEPWRLGANEATELQLFKDARIQDKTIPAGRYVLYCIPSADQWTFVINSNIDSWGLRQDTTKDLARFKVPASTTPIKHEYFSIVFEGNAGNADLLMAWENIEVRLPIVFK
ncbi:MAG TPA: DUF2911 domain-containing protein [Chitinophagaceae bacterium]|nr:DUF2911 domain-containing protein [Chitinophagaceae bacterium]